MVNSQGSTISRREFAANGTAIVLFGCQNIVVLGINTETVPKMPHAAVFTGTFPTTGFTTALIVGFM